MQNKVESWMKKKFNQTRDNWTVLSWCWYQYVPYRLGNFGGNHGLAQQQHFGNWNQTDCVSYDSNIICELRPIWKFSKFYGTRGGWIYYTRAGVIRVGASNESVRRCCDCSKYLWVTLGNIHSLKGRCYVFGLWRRDTLSLVQEKSECHDGLGNKLDYYSVLPATK